MQFYSYHRHPLRPHRAHMHTKYFISTYTRSEGAVSTREQNVNLIVGYRRRCEQILLLKITVSAHYTLYVFDEQCEESLLSLV